MPKKMEWRDGQTDWSGGANSVNDARQLQPNQFVSGVNVLIDTQGGLRRRGGFQRIASSFPGGVCCGATAWINHVGAAETIALFNSGGTTTVYKGGATIPVTLTSVGTYAGTAQEAFFARLTDGAGNPVLYWAESLGAVFANKYYKWSSATSTVTGITPVVTVNPGPLCVHNQRLFAISFVTTVSGLADRLYWSGLNNGDTLGDTANGGGFTRIETAGGALVDIMSVGASLIILHSNGVSRFTGWSADDISVSTQTVTAGSGIGVSRNRACISLGNVGYFLADNGYVYRIDEAGNYEPINLQFPLPVDSSSFYAGVLNDRANTTITWISYNSVSASHYNYNYMTGGWSTTVFSGSPAPPVLSCNNGLDNASPPVMLLATTNSVLRYGLASKDDVLSDGSGGTSITATVTTKKYVGKSYALTKALRFVYLEYNTAAPSTATLSVNGSALSAKPGTQDTTVCWQAGAHGPAASFQVTWTDTGLSATEKLSSIMLEGYEYTERF